MKLKKISDHKYKLFLENQTMVVYEESIIKHKLLYKTNIDKSLEEILYKENDYYENYNKALKFSLRKIRSQKEVEKYLEKINTPFKFEIIKELKEKSILNNQKYINAYINDRVYLSNEGPNKIKNFLLNEFTEKEIDQYLNNFDPEIFEKKITKIVTKKTKTNKKSLAQFRQQLILYLINLGYEYNMIMKGIENIKINSNVLEKEIDKQYKKVSKKYENVDLVNKLKQNLYSKGFSYDEITKALENRNF